MNDATMADHWFWRPGWAVRRRFYTWHLTFADSTDLHRLAADYRKALEPLPGLDLIPDQWIHLTMQGVGFIDEVAEDDVDAIVAAAEMRLAAVPPFMLEFDRPIVTPEAIQWRVDPAGPNQVRDALRAAIGDVWTEVPEQAGGFKAHVSIAYSNATGPQAPIQAALERVESAPAVVRVSEAQLIVLHRDNRMYEWVEYATVLLRG
jgi:2'-5' RNA ligase